MNKFKYYFILIITTLFLFSCSKDDNTVETVPLRDYAEQFAADNTAIEEYLKTYYITVTNNPGEVDDQDVTFTKITDAGTQPSIWSYLDRATFPKLLSREVSLHDITYKMYYLVLREGVGESPCNVDGVLAAYKGQYLTETTVSEVKTITTTQFDELKYPQQAMSLYSVINGWAEIFPQFKTGNHVENSDGTVSYSDFGSGVMFIPSGLGYYTGSGSIPSYSPLLFSFKLYKIQRLDSDEDGVFNYQEDLDSNKYIYDFRNTTGYPTFPEDNIRYADDTDKDGVPNFADIDDDGDGYTTKIEISKGTNYLDKNSHP
jgi:hypothetical protein